MNTSRLRYICILVPLNVLLTLLLLRGWALKEEPLVQAASPLLSTAAFTAFPAISSAAHAVGAVPGPFSWQRIPSPDPQPGSNLNTFFELAAVSANDIWTVGAGTRNGSTAHWDGTSWHLVPPAEP